LVKKAERTENLCKTIKDKKLKETHKESSHLTFSAPFPNAGKPCNNRVNSSGSSAYYNKKIIQGGENENLHQIKNPI